MEEHQYRVPFLVKEVRILGSILDLEQPYELEHEMHSFWGGTKD
jgi:hypothetical protein